MQNREGKPLRKIGEMGRSHFAAILRQMAKEPDSSAGAGYLVCSIGAPFAEYQVRNLFEWYEPGYGPILRFRVQNHGGDRILYGDTLWYLDGEDMRSSEGWELRKIEAKVGPEKPVEPEPEGKKFDSGKRRFSLIPKGVLREVIDVLEHGAAKYGVDNWQKVDDAKNRYYNALHRHVSAWWEDGEKVDPDTGKHHLAHAACNVLFLLWFELNEKP